MSEAREDAARRLWGLWRQGPRPDLADFLAGAGPLGPLDLAAVLRVDQRERWLTGERLPSEHYLRAHAGVAADEEAAIDLVYGEYLLRQEQGEVVAPDEYLRRFPQYAAQLRLQLDFNEALASHGAPSPAADAAGGDDVAGTKPGFPNAPAPPANGRPPALEPRTLPRGAVAAALPADAQQKIEEICNRFESAWVKGLRPRIEDYLTEAAAGQRAALLRELLPLDAGYRRAHGEAPTAAEYLARFAGLDASWLAAAVAAPPGGDSPADPAARPALRRPRAHRVRCPHCHSPIQLIDERPQEVLCPGCGSSFRMQDARGTVSAPSMRLGKFQLLERVGRGAFGAVWRALDVELERVVALKIPHAGLTISSSELQHFLDEARKAARLRHPGIVTIHEVTTLQGMPVIVSDFIHGVTLKELLEVRRPSFRETARLIADAADALHHAHGNGLVHRDVKPANIMVERGGPGADGAECLGRPLVLDFGLALREEAQVTMTVDGEIIGTPAYINPEQAAGRGHHADRRSDVFSLGVVLYEMLCGELPFRGSRLMLLDQVLHDDPRLPRRINERIPRDLETICLKAMAKLPTQRYQTAEEFAADLRRFLAGEPIHARRAGPTERLWRWCRRRPRDAALAATVAGLLLLLAVGSTAAAVWIEREREATEHQKRRAETHLTQSLEAVDLLSGVAEKVAEDTPNMEQQQKDLLEKALGLQLEILQDEPSEAMRKKLAKAHHQMGGIWKALGDLPRAEQEFAEAVAEYRRLADEAGDDDARCGEALNQNDWAEALRAGRPREAPPHYEESLRLLTDLAARESARAATFRQEEARVCNNFGIYLEETGGSDAAAEARKKYDAAIVLLTDLEREDPADPAYAADLARSYINRGQLPGDADAGLEDLGQAIRRLEGLKAKMPSRHDYRYRLGVAYHDRGEILTNQGRLSEARGAQEAAVALLGPLADDYPGHHLYLKELAITLNGLGRVEAMDKHKEEACAAWQRASGIWEKLMGDHSDLPQYKSLAALTLDNMVRLTLDANPAAARDDLEKAFDLQRQALRSSPKNPDYLDRLGRHYCTRARIMLCLGKHAGAAADAKEYLDLDPSDPIHLWSAAGLLAQCVPLAEKDDALGEAARRERAGAYERRALDLLRALARTGAKAGADLDNNEDLKALRSRDGFKRLREAWPEKAQGPP